MVVHFLVYFLYAFTQASIMVRYGIGPGGGPADDPAKDMLGYTLLAPAFTLIGLIWVPIQALSAWGRFISGR